MSIEREEFVYELTRNIASTSLVLLLTEELVRIYRYYRVYILYTEYRLDT